MVHVVEESARIAGLGFALAKIRSLVLCQALASHAYRI